MNEEEISIERKSTPKIKSRGLFILLCIFGVFAVSGIATSFYYYFQYQDIKKNPNLEIENETKELTATLGKFMELPTNETPTLATITDTKKLAGQSFFLHAQNGDKLLAYTKAMQAILYRPSTHKIINVAPIAFEDQKEISKDVQKISTSTAQRKSLSK